VLGGPPEFPTRPDGIPGLHTDDGLTFTGFESVDLGGPVTALSAVSAKPDTATLIDLNTKVSVPKLDPASVAREWVTANILG
jgi:osmoprotectant transport system substrate-binding protein